MNVNDEVKFYHRNNGMPVRDKNGKLIAMPPRGEPMLGRVVKVNPEHIEIVGVDADGDSFDEEGVYVLQPGEMCPRGGRYAVAMDDLSVHPPYSGPM